MNMKLKTKIIPVHLPDRFDEEALTLAVHKVVQQMTDVEVTNLAAAVVEREIVRLKSRYYGPDDLHEVRDLLAHILSSSKIVIMPE